MLSPQIRALTLLLTLLAVACSPPADDSAPQRVAPTAPAVLDAIVGGWSTDKLYSGQMWAAYTPDGQVAYILDPAKAPGEIEPNPATLLAILDTTGKWQLIDGGASAGSIYAETMYRGNAALPAKYYRMEQDQLVQCQQDGAPLSGGLRWSRKFAPTAERQAFVAEYIRRADEARKAVAR